MSTGNRDESEEMRAGATDGTNGTGDEVEQAGETTAAAMIGGDASAEPPVGADTLVEVEGDPPPPSGSQD
jgi:hypothetical protein